LPQLAFLARRGACIAAGQTRGDCACGARQAHAQRMRQPCRGSRALPAAAPDRQCPQHKSKTRHVIARSPHAHPKHAPTTPDRQPASSTHPHRHPRDSRPAGRAPGLRRRRCGRAHQPPRTARPVPLREPRSGRSRITSHVMGSGRQIGRRIAETGCSVPYSRRLGPRKTIGQNNTARMAEMTGVTAETWSKSR